MANTIEEKGDMQSVKGSSLYIDIYLFLAVSLYPSIYQSIYSYTYLNLSLYISPSLYLCLSSSLSFFFSLTVRQHLSIQAPLSFYSLAFGTLFSPSTPTYVRIRVLAKLYNSCLALSNSFLDFLNNN